MKGRAGEEGKKAGEVKEGRKGKGREASEPGWGMEEQEGGREGEGAGPLFQNVVAPLTATGKTEYSASGMNP